MSDVQEYAARLSQTIGPRPAGTEEEQQASFFIEEVLQQEAGLEVQTEEFNCNPNFELPRIIYCLLSIILGALSLFLDLMLIPAFVGCLIFTVLYALDVMDIFTLSRTGKHGVSQNVIGKYYPPSGEQAQTSRRRKVILVARYDSGKIARELRGPIFRALPVLRWVELCAMALMPIVLIIRMIMTPTGTAEIVFMVIMIILMVCVFLPVLSYVMRKTASYSDGANCNAAGVAVMVDVAKRVGLGLYEDEDDFEPVIHGSRAARDEDLIPDGAEVVYADEETEGEIPAVLPIGAAGEASASSAASDQQPNQTSFMEPMSMEASQQEWQAAANASAAVSVAPMQGRPDSAAAATVSNAVAAGASAYQAIDPSTGMPVPGVPAPPAAPTISLEEDDSNVPSWYKRARQKANRSSTDSVPVIRSRFADALDNAVAVSQAAAAEAAAQAQSQPSEIEQRLAAMRQSIMGTAAPVVPSGNAEQQAAHQQAGVGGFLSNTMSSTDYESLQVSEAEVPVIETEMERAANVTDRIISGSPAPHPQAAADKAPQRKKRTISLPSLTGAINAAEVAALAEGTANNKQSEDAAASKPSAGTEKSAADQRKKQASLASSLPSFDGLSNSAANTKKDSKKEAKPSTSNIVSQAGAFAVANETSSFKPVGDELVANMDLEDIYVEDADDSDYGDNITESGAMAGPGYVDMPSSRASRVFGKFRRGRKKQEESLADAIGVDKDFDARKVGKERGGWESFREDSPWEDDEWNGGAFSRESLGRAISRIKPDSNSEDHMPEGEYYEETLDLQDSYADENQPHSNSRRGSGRVVNPFEGIPLRGLSRSEERDMIHDFHNGPINMEVWFVALGAELANNAGMKSFLAQHSSELRGAMIIDLDGLGAGELCMIEREGAYRVAKMSSRMKRYVRKAADSLGMKVGSATMLWNDTAAYCAVKNGYQTLHIAGMMNGKPARMAEADDIYDNLDLDILAENADFTMELIRSI